MLLIEKLAFFALGLVCGGWLVGFIAGAHIQKREQAAHAQGRREGIEEATAKESAMPDLLEACKVALHGGGTIAEAAEKCRAAIAKAERTTVEPVEISTDASPVIASRETVAEPPVQVKPRPEEIEAARFLAGNNDDEKGAYCGGIECNACPFNTSIHPITHHAARAWLAANAPKALP